MRIILFLSLILTGFSCLAQDLDYPDFRSKKDNFAKIREPDIRADLASFALAALDESIGKAVLQTVPTKDFGVQFPWNFKMTISMSSSGRASSYLPNTN